MRLFIAINFNEEIKDRLCDIMERLKDRSFKGNFTLRENLHLTVVFIGEVAQDEVNRIKEAMDNVVAEPFELGISGFGSFRREGGNLYWVGVDKNETLTSINQQLSARLAKAGFAIEEREFKPHLTLGRKVVTKDNFNRHEFAKEVPQMSMRVDTISLMKSERINEKLTYTEIYSSKLIPENNV